MTHRVVQVVPKAGIRRDVAGDIAEKIMVTGATLATAAIKGIHAPRERRVLTSVAKVRQLVAYNHVPTSYSPHAVAMAAAKIKGFAGDGAWQTMVTGAILGAFVKTRATRV